MDLYIYFYDAMNIDALNNHLMHVKSTLDDGQIPATISVRELLRWVDAERRGANVVYEIRQALRHHGLKTEPNFNYPSLDADVQFILDKQDTPSVSEYKVEVVGEVLGEVAVSASAIAMLAECQVEQPQLLGGGPNEPAFRISRLDAANKKPVYVAPDCTLSKAMTIMLINDFSQLPVMTSDRDVKGVVTWSSIASHLQFDTQKPDTVRQCMEKSQEVKESDSLFDVIRLIASTSYVLVRAEDKRIKGIVTSTDLNLQFQQLSEPFLLLGEIENFIRSMLDGRFTAEELIAAQNPSDKERVINSVADLTFGEAKRLLERPEYWGRVGLQLDRLTFIDELERIRQIRNDVMHFDPDPISHDDHETLRAFVHFLHKVDRFN